MDTFNYMRAFRRIVEMGSLAQAAEDLDMSSAGLSKQLRALEAHLGAVLIQRTTRKMSLTDTGAAYYAECCRLLDELDALERSVKQQSRLVAGRLRVNAPVSFALSVLSPLLARFLRQYPELRLDLSMEDRLVDAVGLGFDVSIRLRAQLDDSTLIARRLASLTQVLCAAPSYLDRRGRPDGVQALHGHDVLSYTLAEGPETMPDEDGGARADPLAGSALVQVNNSLMLRDMLEHGLGIGALPSFLAAPAIARGKLVRVLPDLPAAPRHVYAVYPTSRHLQPKVKAFVDFLAEHLPAAMRGDS
ncbi:LysR family transcriptional regulator [Achromobacter insolitus]|uniref:LysR family transcriptional regulator n=1 Tax=Achromobacter insolitus TaxID=217204 RepID=UPI0011EB42DF|nr:LysR family transcriptional regulator [Achromobacter insolitus]MDQ6213937.1 LysR substrate-binding domain-containing protein [Achromobacter insolitus]QEK91310.1 LysR family transcriptional regulator [Achromobacter insolitus]